jgi:hypothetical protein
LDEVAEVTGALSEVAADLHDPISRLAVLDDQLVDVIEVKKAIDMVPQITVEIHMPIDRGL